MTTQSNSGFSPDYEQKHPGHYLGRILESRGIKQVDFAKRCGRPKKTISEIVAGKAPITPETALQFERVLGESASVWLAMEAEYQLGVAKGKARTAWVGPKGQAWARQFPLNEMVTYGFLEEKPAPENRVEALLKFFRISSPAAWERLWSDRVDLAYFKQSSKMETSVVATWLNQGERIAAHRETQPYNESQFRGALDNALELTLMPWHSVQQRLIDLCASAGVALALVPHLPKLGLRGAAFWASKDKAVIVLSDRGKSEAMLWFAFFHECLHILQHSKKAVFIDSSRGEGNSAAELEREADDFSANYLVAPEHVETFKRTFGEKAPNITADDVRLFADSISVAPDLLLERLKHHDIIRHDWRHNAKFRRSVEFDACEPID